jgi:hypothetical protein
MDSLRKKSEKSLPKLYMIIWVILTVLLFLIRFLLSNVIENQLVGLFFGYLLIVSLPFGMTIIDKQRDIFNYLQAHHKKEWEKRFGKELSIYTFSGARQKRMYYSKEDFGDPILKLKRKDFRSFYVLTYVVIICSILIDIIMLLVFSVK